ncbi:MAG: polysaccharide pyruvyl transferase family protein, partial [Angustibacter sp.]
RGVDSGFALRAPAGPSAAARWGLPTELPVVGLTARAWLPGPEQADYELALARLIDHLQRDLMMAVVLIPQVACDYLGDDDRITQARIAELCQTPPHVITEQLPPHELARLYAELDVLIGTRFHSVIFALTHGVPAIAIAYEHKTTGIMRDLGLSSWVVPIERVARTDLSGLFARLVEERADYRNHLAEVIPPYIARAQHTTCQLRAVLRRRSSPGPAQGPAQAAEPPAAAPAGTVAP